MKYCKISEFTTVVTGGTPSTAKTEFWDGDIPWVNSGALNDGDIIKPSRYITKLGLESSSTKMMPSDTVLIALTGTTTGQAAYLRISACANQSVTGILPSEKHFPRYLYHYLRTRKDKIQADAFGGAQPHINQQYVKDLIIPLPPLSEQKRISEILDKADSIRKKRAETLALPDKLIRSTFIEMFGDPRTNPKKWKIKKISDLITRIESGKSLASPNESTENCFRVLKVSAVTWGKYDPSESKPLPANYNPPNERHIVQVGDFLFTRANTSELVGAVTIVRETPLKILLPDKIWRICWNELVTPEFACYLLRTPEVRRLMSDDASGSSGSMKNISQQKLLNISVYLPDIEYQNEFSSFVLKCESLQKELESSSLEAEILFKSLQTQFFQ